MERKNNPPPPVPGRARADRAILAALILVGAAARIGFWRRTGLTFEDALITFRYAENLAAGTGFVYNAGEAVLGTTSPLWTLMLAAARRLGAPDTAAAARGLALLFDTATLTLLFEVLRRSGRRRTALLWGALFATSSGVVPISMSGMETPLLLFAMALTITGWSARTSAFGIGLAITMLTRIDGLLFAGLLLGAALTRDRRWALRQAALAGVILLPWIAYAVVSFGSVLPQSLAAKRVAYAFDLPRSAAPFIARFTPFGGSGHAAFLLKLVSSTAAAAGIFDAIRRRSFLLPLAVWFLLYVLLFGTSGVPIFPWYLTPATFAHDLFLAGGVAWLIGRFVQSGGGAMERRFGAPAWPGALTMAAALALAAIHLVTMAGRLGEYRERQGIEDGLRRPIGEWLRENAGAGDSVFLEPIGYIGYFAGPGVRIIDEVGIVSPEVTALRRRGHGWYVEALRTLCPEWVVQYTRSLEENIAEGTSEALFRDAAERDWFEAHYRPVRRFEVRDALPHVERKETRYTLLRRMGP